MSFYLQLASVESSDSGKTGSYNLSYSVQNTDNSNDDNDTPTTEDVTDTPTTEDVTDTPTTEDVTDTPTTEDVTDTPTNEDVTDTPTNEDDTNTSTNISYQDLGLGINGIIDASQSKTFTGELSLDNPVFYNEYVNEYVRANPTVPIEPNSNWKYADDFFLNGVESDQTIKVSLQSSDFDPTLSIFRVKSEVSNSIGRISQEFTLETVTEGRSSSNTTNTVSQQFTIESGYNYVISVLDLPREPDEFGSYQLTTELI